MDFVMGWGLFKVEVGGGAPGPWAWSYSKSAMEILKRSMESATMVKLVVLPCAFDGRFAFDHGGL